MSPRTGKRRSPKRTAPAAEWQPYDAGDPAFAAALLAPRWEVVRLLGRGALACTHLVTDRESGARAVARVVHSAIAEDDSARAHIHRLSRAALALEHPNLVRMIAVSPESAHTPYAVCEYVEGTDLASLLRAEGRLPLARALAVARDIAAALAAVHARGLTHGNLRPADILVETASGRAKLYELDSPLFGGSGVLGNPSHAAPEQLEDPGSGPRPPADLFALGTILYEMLTGAEPFPADSPFQKMAKKMKGSWTPLHEHAAEIPKAVANLLDYLLSPDPAKRGTAAQSHAELELLAGA